MRRWRLQIAKAKVFGTDDQVKVLQNAFDFNVCDPFWSQCVDEYVNFFKLRGSAIPYREGLNNVLPTPVSANAKIALFGDWGTGTEDAIDLLQQIKGFNPDILMHLGDVYYSGTQDEMQERFLDVCDSVFGASMPPRFSLSGNHDMYSSGAGYYWLVDQLGQGASYFAIQNNDWLFIVMDTGVHDYNPLQGGSEASYLMSTEADWVNNLVAKKGNKKVVFLSHHPLFSAYDPIGGASLNAVLLNQIQASLPNVTAWFWGHEHRLGVYDPFQNTARTMHRPCRRPGLRRRDGRSAQTRGRTGPPRERNAAGHGHRGRDLQARFRDHDPERAECDGFLLPPGRHQPALGGDVLSHYR